MDFGGVSVATGAASLSGLAGPLLGAAAVLAGLVAAAYILNKAHWTREEGIDSAY